MLFRESRRLNAVVVTDPPRESEGKALSPLLQQEALQSVVAAAAPGEEERECEGSVEHLWSGGSLKLAGPRLVVDGARRLVVRLIVGKRLLFSGVRKREDEER